MRDDLHVITNLIDKHLKGEVWGEDQAILEDWLKEEKNRLFFEEITDREKLQKKMVQYYLLKSQKAEVKDQFKERLREKGYVINIKRFWNWQRSVAAACAFLLLSFAVYKALNRKEHPIAKGETQAKRYKNDVNPGSNAATLILADGKKILIDSSVNGNIAKQRNVQIVKENGNIIYRFSGTKKTDEVEYNEMQTANGEQYQLVLADGTKVWMNAASSIKFPTTFIGNERRVEVNGELYFEVTKNTKTPFIVQHGDMSVRVTGTEFNVNTYDNEKSMLTTLVRGSVKVTVRETHGEKVQMLSPGQQAAVEKEGKINLVKDADVDEATAWKDGRFAFQGASIETIMRQIERWYNVQVHYEGTVNTVFRVNVPRNVPVSQLLEMMEMTKDVKFKIDGKTITVMP